MLYIFVSTCFLLIFSWITEKVKQQTQQQLQQANCTYMRFSFLDSIAHFLFYRYFAQATSHRTQKTATIKQFPLVYFTELSFVRLPPVFILRFSSTHNKIQVIWNNYKTKYHENGNEINLSSTKVNCVKYTIYLCIFD